MKKILLPTFILIILLVGCGKKEECVRGTLQDGVCVYIESSEPEITCDGQLSADKKECLTEVVEKASTKRVCPNGFSEKGEYCYSNQALSEVTRYRCAKSQQEYNTYIDKKPTKGFWKAELLGSECQYYFCETYVDGKCVGAEAWKKKAIPYQTCPENTFLYLDKCYRRTGGTTGYTCPEGYELKDKNCVIKKTVEPTYVCERGTYNPETKKCEERFEAAPGVG